MCIECKREEPQLYREESGISILIEIVVAIYCTSTQRDTKEKVYCNVCFAYVFISLGESLSHCDPDNVYRHTNQPPVWQSLFLEMKPQMLCISLSFL